MHILSASLSYCQSFVYSDVVLFPLHVSRVCFNMAAFDASAVCIYFDDRSSCILSTCVHFICSSSTLSVNTHMQMYCD